jgi:transcriptional regulator with PAS, ATPase and Fis domain
VGRDEDSWGAALKPHLGYFEAEDIKGKVAELSTKLRRRTRELAKERKRLASLERRRSPFLAESRSKAMGEVVSLAERVARFDTPVLITGETGVGKEVVARHMHSISPMAGGPFLAVNCGALPETLLESELFGHKKGSFTGAVADRVGLFEQASGGTIFLDEIGDISPAMQLKILRVIQEREIMRVGESRPRKVDARLIAATHRDLDETVATGAFREDLLYRLRVVEIEVPPLRERAEDIVPLARHLVDRLAKRLGLQGLHLDSTVIDHLLRYHWPGNVRELDNAIERAAILGREAKILPENLPPVVLRGGSALAFGPGAATRSLASMEMEYIDTVLETTGGNRTRAAKILGISPTTLWRKLKNRARE